MLVKDVVDAVRTRLGDTSAHRWSNEQLVLYVALAQSAICAYTSFYKQHAFIPLVDDRRIYDLPDDCLVVNRLEYNQQFFPIETRNSIDRGDAKYPCALKDNLEYNKIEIILDTEGYGLQEVFESAFGVYVEASNPFGVSADAGTDELVPPYGVLSGGGKSFGNLLVYYSAVPSMKLALTDKLVLPDAYFNAFFHYVTGTALQDDNDANNIQRGELELAKYSAVLGEIAKRTSLDYTSSIKSKLVTPRRI